MGRRCSEKAGAESTNCPLPADCGGAVGGEPVESLSPPHFGFCICWAMLLEPGKETDGV